ncbi:hypothetical protein BSK62_16930 [Paenibacillus odorifer]|uniref:hypothetical protein n=1 Tax=Paenibacillus odorifer TaxID=189426 RepID=UPI00096C6196|nr:hypothetical protein [Paenibacillus odorifer]OMD64654.1 hypothetical protein BSK62_16930 [Paenibacillus odorifer]
MENKIIGINNQDKIGLSLNKVGIQNEYRVGIQAALTPMFETLNKVQSMMSSIEIPKFQMPEIKFPEIQFPEIEIRSMFDIDWDVYFDDLKEECLSNTKYGWCLSAEMPVGAYRSIARSEDNQEKRDQLFVQGFEHDDFYLYKKEKEYITSTSTKGWKKFYEECFYSIENSNYKVVVPSLVSAIEYELSDGLNVNSIGKKLIKEIQDSINENNELESFSYTIGFSVIALLENSIFQSHAFNKDRASLINRNWVLHGRDNPSFWGKTDVYKLITIISALKMIKE